MKAHPRPVMSTHATRLDPEARAALTDVEIRSRAVHLLATILERDPANVQQAKLLRADLGMDSLSALEFLSSLSHEFDINLEVEETYGLTTLDEVVSLVAARVRGSV